MKKTIIILAFAMAVMFCVLLAGCGNSGGGGADLSDSKYVGTWKAVNMSLEDESEDFGVAVDEEGVEETTTFTWEPTDEGFKTKGDMKLKFTDDGEQIHAKMFGVSLNFEKQ